LYPTSIFYSVIHVWYCELVAVLLLCAVIIAITAQPPATLARSMLFGALTGVIVLTDPTFAIYLALLLVWMLWVQRAQLAMFAGSLVVAGVALAAVISPWAAHNWIHQGYPMIVKSNFGEAVFLGNNSLASGETTRAERLRAYSTLDPEELKHYQSQPERVADRYFLKQAARWISDNPLRFAELTLERIGYFWMVNTSKGRKAWLRIAYYGPLLMLAVFGLWIGRHRLWDLAPLWLFMLVQPLPYYVTHVAAGRYSYPVELIVVSLAAVPIAMCFRRDSIAVSPRRAGGVDEPQGAVRIYRNS
jgi:4-amino-4-deoxy-L-arabinose transferase-like glycosyltransferase